MLQTQGLENNVKYIEMNGFLIEKVFAKSFAVQFPWKCSDIFVKKAKMGSSFQCLDKKVVLKMGLDRFNNEAQSFACLAWGLLRFYNDKAQKCYCLSDFIH